MFQWMIVSQSVPFLVKNLRSFGMTSTRYVVHYAWYLTLIMLGLTLICLTITMPCNRFTLLQPFSDAFMTVCRSGDTRMRCKLVLRMLLDMACKKVLLCWKAHWQEHLAAVRMPCQIKFRLHQKKQRYGQRLCCSCFLMSDAYCHAPV